MQRTGTASRRRSRGRLILSSKERRKLKEVRSQDESRKRKKSRMISMLGGGKFRVDGDWNRVSRPRLARRKETAQGCSGAELEANASVDGAVEPICQQTSQKQAQVVADVSQSSGHQHDDIDWTLFNNFGVEFLRFFCDDERVHVPPFPAIANSRSNNSSSSVDALPTDDIRQHYLAAIYAHMDNKRSTSSHQQKIVGMGDKAEDNVTRPSQNGRETPKEGHADAHVVRLGRSQRITDQNDKQTQQQQQQTPRRSPRLAQRSEQDQGVAQKRQTGRGKMENKMRRYSHKVVETAENQ